MGGGGGVRGYSPAPGSIRETVNGPRDIFHKENIILIFIIYRTLRKHEEIKRVPGDVNVLGVRPVNATKKKPKMRPWQT